jgi:hypothetical protein
MYIGRVRLFQSVGLVCLSLAVSLLVAEFLVRQWFPVYSTVYALDDKRLHRYKANAWKVYIHSLSNGGARVIVKTNSRGYRGPEFADRPNKPRVLVYGDSFIAAEYSELPDTYVEQLARVLSKMGPPVEVINAGVPAYGPDQESVYAQQGIAGLQPSLVIVSIYAGNDFGDLLRDKLFRLSLDGRLQENNWQIDPKLSERFAKAQFDESKLLNRSMLIRVGKQLYGALRKKKSKPDRDLQTWLDRMLGVRQKEYQDFVENNDNVVRNLFRDGYDADVSMLPESASARYKVNLMEQVLLRIRDITSSAGIPLLYVFVPSPIDVCDDYDPQVNAAKHTAYKRSALTDRLEEIARRNNLPFVNLFDSFRGSGCKLLFYGAGNGHWNKRGQALAARVTADYVERFRMLDRKP